MIGKAVLSLSKWRGSLVRMPWRHCFCTILTRSPRHSYKTVPKIRINKIFSQKNKNTQHLTKSSGLPVFKGVPTGEVFAKHLINTSHCCFRKKLNSCEAVLKQPKALKPLLSSSLKKWGVGEMLVRCRRNTSPSTLPINTGIPDDLVRCWVFFIKAFDEGYRDILLQCQRDHSHLLVHIRCVKKQKTKEW